MLEADKKFIESMRQSTQEFYDRARKHIEEINKDLREIQEIIREIKDLEWED